VKNDFDSAGFEAGCPLRTAECGQVGSPFSADVPECNANPVQKQASMRVGSIARESRPANGPALEPGGFVDCTIASWQVARQPFLAFNFRGTFRTRSFRELPTRFARRTGRNYANIALLLARKSICGSYAGTFLNRFGRSLAPLPQAIASSILSLHPWSAS